MTSFKERKETYKYKWNMDSVYDSYYCNHVVPPVTYEYTANSLYESVESVRGKPQFVLHGTRQRRKFNPFRRVKYGMNSGLVPGWVCENDPRYKGYVNNFAYQNIYGKLNRSDWEVVKGSIWDGDPPPMFPYQLSPIGVKYRDFVRRDLFVKVKEPRFNVSAFLVELDETVVGIYDLFKGLLSAYKSHHKLRRHTKNLVMNPQDLWLWWRYALMPVMMDVESIIELFNQKRVFDRVQAGDQYESSESGTINLLGYGLGNYDISIPWTANVTSRCGGALDILLRHDPYEWGTSPWDILGAAYERIPFSFIFDWFVNVGAWVTSFRELELKLAQSYSTYAIEAQVELTSAEPYYVAGPTSCFCFVQDRVVDIEPPTLPLVDDRWRNTLRVIDLISLAIGTLKGVLSANGKLAKGKK